jgi:hypothetical protein
LASIFLLLRQKKDTKDKAVKQLWTALAGPEGIKAQLLQKATPERSKARNKISSLRQRRNSRAASVSPLKHSAF